MSATVVYVAFHTPSLDLAWLPEDVDVRIVVNGGDRPAISPPERPVTWLEPGENIGFGAAVNLASDALSTNRLIIVNPDCRLERRHWLALADGRPNELVTVPLVSDQGPTTVASVYPGPLRHVLGALRIRARLRSRLGEHKGTSAGGGLHRGQRASLRTRWASGACLAVDLTRFRSIGGFSDRYFLYYEDLDLSARLAASFPDMEVVVADVEPGYHGVAGSSHASAGRAAVERARSAATYAQGQSGYAWRGAAMITTCAARRSVKGAPIDAGGPADVVIVSLGRASSRGERRRARSWADLAAPGRVVELRLLDDARWAGPVELCRKIGAVVRGHAVPESLAWSTERARRRLAELSPTTVIVLTSRAFDARFCPTEGTFILDFVDRLSDSYADRARASTSLLGRASWWMLARAQGRFENAPRSADLYTAAGRADAELLHAEYIPITACSAIAKPPSAPGHDVAFVGNLRYPPNLEAIAELAALWSEVLRRRPGTRLLLAGANPTEELEVLAAKLGWTVRANFDDEAAIYADTRVAVAPLLHASGIQTKVIDALRHAIPVVGFRVAAAGFESDHPIVLAADRREFVDALAHLLADEDARIALGSRSAEWVDERLGPERWRGILHRLLGQPLGERPRR